MSNRTSNLYNGQLSLIMKIYFATKAENNERRRQDFLALSPHERVCWYLSSLKHQTFRFDRKTPEEKGNFVIEKRNDAI